MRTITDRVADKPYGRLTGRAYAAGLGISAYRCPVTEGAACHRFSGSETSIAIQTSAQIRQDMSRCDRDALAARLLRDRQWLEERLLAVPEDADTSIEGAGNER